MLFTKWGVIDGEVVKLWCPHGEIQLHPDANQNIVLPDPPSDMHIFNTRKAARKYLKPKFRKADPMVGFVDQLVNQLVNLLQPDLREDLEVPAAIIDKIEYLLRTINKLNVDLKDSSDRLNRMADAKQQAVCDMQDEHSKRLDERADYEKKMRGMTDKKEAYDQINTLQEQLNAAKQENMAYEIKCEALHCHQLMLIAQRAQLQKRVKELEAK